MAYVPMQSGQPAQVIIPIHITDETNHMCQAFFIRMRTRAHTPRVCTCTYSHHTHTCNCTCTRTHQAEDPFHSVAASQISAIAAGMWQRHSALEWRLTGCRSETMHFGSDYCLLSGTDRPFVGYPGTAAATTKARSAGTTRRASHNRVGV